jgi:hypothetical protein
VAQRFTAAIIALLLISASAGQEPAFSAPFLSKLRDAESFSRADEAAIIFRSIENDTI